MSQERHYRRGRQTANHDMADARREGAGFSQLTQVAAEAATAATTGPLPIVTAPSEPILSGTSRQAHFHRKPRTGWLASLMEHRGRFASFSVIGGGVFLLGLAMQVVLVRRAHVDAVAAFFLQGFVSVQVSFLLNHFWTWRAERVPFWQACWKFNVSKVLTTVANLALYAGLVRSGMNYVIANVATTALFTVVNYVTGHYWAFSRKTPGAVTPDVADQALLALDLDVEPQPWWPSVSVVVPCKNNPGTIRATVEALLGQEYPALKEVVLVGSQNDTTWTALADIHDHRLVLLEQPPVEGFRDPAMKRDKGVSKSCGDVIALADSDIVMEPRWLARGVAALLAQGGGVVAGGMRSIHDTFWGRFVDQNRLGAKTPRLPLPYLVTAENFGGHHRKPPVTANVMLTREVYEDQPIDKTWMYGYEDYEWFWRVAKAGHRILFTDQLTGAHHHRRSFRHLVTEYRRAALGCAMFIRKHPDSPLARKRRQQAFLLPLTGLAGLVGAGLAVTQGDGLAIAAVLVGGMVSLMAREFAHSRTAESLAYPLAGGTLGFVFTAGVAQGLLGAPSAAESGPAWVQGSTSSHQRLSRRFPWPLAILLPLQAVLSLSLIWSNTAFGDEALYLWAGRIELAKWLYGASLATGTDLNGHSALNFQAYFSGAPQIYPPLGALADSIGGLAAARILSLVFMLIATVLLYYTAQQLFGKVPAIIACALWAVSEPCLKLGAFATYDAMAVCIICAGAMVATRVPGRYCGEKVALASLLFAVGMIVTYSYIIYVPAVIAMATASWVPLMGRRLALSCAGWMVGATTLCFVGMTTVLKLWPGLLFTVFNRKVAVHQGYLLVANGTWSWEGIVMCLSLLGILAAISARHRITLLVILSASSLLVPLQQERLQTGTSLDKHLSMGIWLAAMGAGYGISYILRLRIPMRLALTCGCAAALIPAITGWDAAEWSFQGWNNSASLTGAVDRIAARTNGLIAIENTDPSVIRFATSNGTDWMHWVKRWSSIPLSASRSQDLTALRQKDFGVVVMAFNSPGVFPLAHTAFTAHAGTSRQAAFEQALVRLLAGNPGLSTLATTLLSDHWYQIAEIVPYGHNLSQTAAACVIWKRTGGVR